MKYPSEMRQRVIRHVNYKLEYSAVPSLLIYKSEQVIIPLIINNLTLQLNTL